MNTPSNGQIAGAGMGFTAGGSLLSAGGAIASGFANSNMYNYNAAIARLNQQIDTQNAEFAIQTGKQQQFQSGLQASQQMGRIKAAQSSSGFDVNSGSSKQVRTSQTLLERLNSTQIRSNAAKVAYGYQEQGAVAGAQASMYGMAANNALTAGFIGAGSSILGGAGSVASQWLQGANVGLWGGGAGSGGSTQAYTMSNGNDY